MSRVEQQAPSRRPHAARAGRSGLAAACSSARSRASRTARSSCARPTASRRFGDPGRRAARCSRCTIRASSRRLARSGRLAVGEGYQAGEWSSPDLPGLVALLARNHEQVFGRPPLSLLAALGAPRPAHRAAARPAPRRAGRPRPLRPRQRVLRALAGRVDDLLLRALRDARGDARRGAAGQVPRARGCDADRPGRPRARDRHRLGRLRAAPRARARLPGDHRHDLARAARARDRSAWRRPGWPTASRSSTATTGSSRARTAASSRSR